MVNFPSRNGRRRRVLKDEVLSPSGSHFSLHTPADALPQAPRYSDAAGVENHPQVTDFVPRRYRTIALLVVTGIATTLALAALDYFAPSVATALGVGGLPPLGVMSSGSVAAWVSAVVLIVASVLCLLVYSIRRYRIDDIRGRYRIWPAAAAACVILSADSVVGLHAVLARAMGHVTGWTALRGGAVWWLALAGLPLAWLAVRLLLDVRECRVAAGLLVASIIGYASATTSFLGFIPVVEPPIDSILPRALALVGHWLLLAAVASYARFIVLDAQGLIPIRAPRKSRPQKDRSTAQQSKAAAAAAGSSSSKQPQPQPSAAATSLKGWIDGRRPERVAYDEDAEEDTPGERKLSKADRKRLRKLKAQNRAA